MNGTETSDLDSDGASWYLMVTREEPGAYSDDIACGELWTNALASRPKASGSDHSAISPQHLGRVPPMRVPGRATACLPVLALVSGEAFAHRTRWVQLRPGIRRGSGGP